VEDHHELQVLDVFEGAGGELHLGSPGSDQGWRSGFLAGHGGREKKSVGEHRKVGTKQGGNSRQAPLCREALRFSALLSVALGAFGGSFRLESDETTESHRGPPKESFPQS